MMRIHGKTIPVELFTEYCRNIQRMERLREAAAFSLYAQADQLRSDIHDAILKHAETDRNDTNFTLALAEETERALGY